MARNGNAQKLALAVMAMAMSAGVSQAARAQEVYLGHAHVDGPRDHDDIHVERYAGRFHWIILRVDRAPIQFDRVVVHYGNRTSEILPVSQAIGPGQSSRWIELPGGERRIRSLELWYARAAPEIHEKPEVQLFGRP